MYMPPTIRDYYLAALDQLKGEVESTARRDNNQAFSSGSIEDLLVPCVLKIEFSDVHGILLSVAQLIGKRRGQRPIDEQLHCLAASGRVRSRTASAANSSASRTSSASRSG